MNTIKNRILKHQLLLITAVILIAATVFRFYNLGLTPRGMTWDEAAIGYNGFSIWTTRRDEWLKFLPVSFQSFGDYKAPLAIYINGFFTSMLGLNLFAVRFPFALSSIIAIIVGIFLNWGVATLTNLKKPLAFSLIVASFFSFSPWHIHFSRAGFESGMSLSFLLVGISLLLLFILKQIKPAFFQKVPKQLLASYSLLFFSSGFLVASMYTYHSAKIATPLFGLLVVVTFFKFWKKNIKKLLFVAAVSSIFLLPMAWDSFHGPGAARLGQTSVFSTQGSPIEKSSLLLSNFFSHFNPSFLMFGESDHLRHGNGRWGVLFPTTLAFAVFALGKALLDKVSKNKSSINNLVIFFLFWIVIGIVPSALGIDEVPHSNRALLALPGFLGLSALGVMEIISLIEKSVFNKKVSGNHGEKNTVRDAVIGSIIIIHGIFFLSFWQYYNTSFATNSSADYQDGYLQAFEIVQQYEKGEQGFPQVEKIVFSDEYGQPYIYALVSRKTSPIYYRGGSLIKYEFKSVDIGDFQRKNALIVASAKNTDFPDERADHIIYGGNGEIRFHLYYLP